MVALAEGCISQQIARETPRLIGATVDLTSLLSPSLSSARSGGEGARRTGEEAPRLDALLFGESQSRVVVSCKPLDAVKVIERAKLLGVPAARIGHRRR
jgi:phosphoribosylformylglycinamidine synthase